MKIIHTENYQLLREREYPSAGQLADAIFWNSRGDSTKLNDYLATVEAIKAKYPKPAD